MPIRISPVNGIYEAIFFCLQFGLENQIGFQVKPITELKSWKVSNEVFNVEENSLNIWKYAMFLQRFPFCLLNSLMNGRHFQCYFASNPIARFSLFEW